MQEFFSYESPYRTGQFIELSMFEYIAPFVLLLGLILLLVYYKDILKQDEDKQRILQRSVGVLFIVLYGSHYVLRFILYGFDTIILPFHLCGISMAFAMVLLFTNNRTIYTFVLYTGVLGGLISLFTPIIGYNALYYRYYQFYLAHIILILTPLYFLIVKDYVPSKGETVKAFWVLQALIVFMGGFNLIFGTDFMFVFLDPIKEEKFPLITRFGGVPYYIIFAEMLVVALFYVMYQGITKLSRLRVGDIEYKNV